MEQLTIELPTAKLAVGEKTRWNVDELAVKCCENLQSPFTQPQLPPTPPLPLSLGTISFTSLNPSSTPTILPISEASSIKSKLATVAL
ncbi:hypothetical protein PVK06_016116 [Gossypium arboreum]|uniref:Uncharacterized protein n=1 Tax=Gossypium arboreum TaxID=29729 RepID=A0ABR0PZ38_GOSAR|nr:hypothetical protein PVK06_016116 [Gossypium arboreum]